MFDFKKQFKKPDQRGFSLIEMIVSIYIIAIISSMVVFNYQKGDSQTTLNVHTQMLATDIRSAQNYALAQNEINGISTSSWGVRFNMATPDRYIVYADMNGNYSYEGSEKFREVIMPENMELKSLALDGVAANPLDIVFVAPYPDTYFNGSSSTNDVAEIVLRQTKFGSSSVEVNAYGLINASESFKINILLNSASGLDCTQVCQNAGFSGCTSVGTNEAADDGTRWRQTGPNCNLQPGPFNCGHTMTVGNRICGGYMATWTRCNCN